MIPVDYPPPKIEMVYEIPINLPKKENIRIYPVQFFEEETFRCVNVSVEDIKQYIWISDIIIYFDPKNDFVTDLKVPREIKSLSSKDDWHQEYLERVVKFLLKIEWKTLMDAYNEGYPAMLNTPIGVSNKRNVV